MSPASVEAPAPGRQRDALWRWVGLAGALLLALGATGAGVLPRPDPLRDAPVLRLLRTGPGPTVCIVAAALGMAVLLVAWWRIRPAAPAGVSTREVRRITVTAVWWSAPLLVAPPLFSRDIYSYAAQGALLGAGLDPYAEGVSALDSPWVGSVSPTWTDTPAPYGPLFLWLARGAAELSGGHLLAALLLLRVVAVGGTVLIAVAVPVLARACDVDPARAQWLALANPLVLVHAVSGAHNDALMVGLFTAALALVARPLTVAFSGGQGAPDPPKTQQSTGVAAAALVGLAVAVKAAAVVVLPFVAVLWARDGRGRWPLVRACVAGAAVALVALAGASVLAGLGPGWVVALVSTPGASVQWTSLPTGWGVAAGWIADALGRGDLADELLGGAHALGAALTAALLVALWWRVRHRFDEPRTVVAAAGWALAAVVVLGAAFHPWYALWALVPLAASGGPRVAFWLAVVSTALCVLVLPDGYNLARSTLVPGVVAGLLSTCALMVLALRWVHRRTAASRPSSTGAPR